MIAIPVRLLIAATVAAGLTQLFACRRSETAPEPVRAVRTMTLAADSAGASHEYAAEVRARVESRLGLRVAGKLVSRAAEVGQRVKAGQVLAQIEAQLEKMVSTRHVQDVTRDPNGLERELALIKVRGTGAERVEALRVADIFRARVIDTTHESFVFEATGAPGKIDGFVELMRSLGADLT